MKFGTHYLLLRYQDTKDYTRSLRNKAFGIHEGYKSNIKP
jgi:hypothetical protein